ncbi:hypothetical protein YW7DRAFT_01745 [Streptomyces sp. AmelKG-E11A]|nr:hypothetical protein YW7DRAFT_01745 [Streptomyces sp. AmelKG-E11A]
MSRSEFAALVVTTGQQAGERVGCTARLVAAWEDGEVGWPRGVYRRLLTRLTQRPPEQLGFRPSNSPGRTIASMIPSNAHHAGIDRRDFLLEGAGTALSVPLTALPDKSHGKIGAADVRAVDTAVSVIYGHDHDHGSAALRHDAAAALRTAYQWLQVGSYSDRTGKQLRSAIGYLSIAAGWLSCDSGQVADARSLYGEALAAARISDDHGLEGHAFGCLSLVARANGQPREAITAAQAAQHSVRTYGSARMLSLFAMREAGGWALLGDSGMADRAVVLAHSLYAKGPADADPDWLEFYTPAELAGLEALARADLAQHSRAAAGAEQAVLLHGGQFTRNRALYQADVAIQYSIKEQPELESAVAAAGQLLTYFPDVRSERLVAQLSKAASALARHASVPLVADWLAECRTVIREG